MTLPLDSLACAACSTTIILSVFGTANKYGEGNVHKPVRAVRSATVLGGASRRHACFLCLLAGAGRETWGAEQAARFYPRRLQRLSTHARPTRHQEDAPGT